MLNVIVNPKVHKMKKLVAEVDRRFKERGATCRFFYSSKRGDARKYAHSLTAAGQTELVVIGGDGTVNEVLSGMVDPSAVTLGIIPAGTGNDFASVAGIPLGAKAVDVILDGEAQPTDYIECGTRRSLNIAGTGMDTLCEGRFDVEGYENVRISLDPQQDCYIVVLTDEGLTRIFNLMTEAETEGFYAELTAAL